MAKQVLSGAKLYVGGYDLSGDHNALALTYGADTVEQTCLSDTSHVRAAGLKVFQASHAGLWSGGTGNVDETLFGTLGTNVPSTICPTNGAPEGDVAYFGTMSHAGYNPAGSIGDSLKFTVGLEAASALYRGTILHNASRSATGTGTIFNLGAVPTGKAVAMAVHLTSITGGGSVQVKLESAALVGFASPSPRIDLGAQSLPFGAVQSVAGPNTDAFWRVTWTVVGTATFSFIAVVSIQ